MSHIIPHPAQSFAFGLVIFVVIVFYSLFFRKRSRDKVVYSILSFLLALTTVTFFIGGIMIKDMAKLRHDLAVQREAENRVPEKCNNNAYRVVEVATDEVFKIYKKSNDPWKDVQKAFDGYRECLKWFQATTVDELIYRVLIERWDKVSSLAEIKQQDPLLYSQILTALESEASLVDDTKKIHELSKKCPSRLREVCADIHKASSISVTVAKSSSESGNGASEIQFVIPLDLPSEEYRPLLHALFDNTIKWDSYLSIIKSGNAVFLRTWPKFRNVSDAAITLDLDIAMGNALEVDPQAVFKEITNFWTDKNQAREVVSGICRSVSNALIDENSTANVKQLTMGMIKKRIYKVQSLKDTEVLREPKRVCLDALQESQKFWDGQP